LDKEKNKGYKLTLMWIWWCLSKKLECQSLELHRTFGQIENPIGFSS